MKQANNVYEKHTKILKIRTRHRTTVVGALEQGLLGGFQALRGNLVAHRVNETILQPDVVLEAGLALFALVVLLPGEEAAQHIAALQCLDAVAAVALLYIARE